MRQVVELSGYRYLKGFEDDNEQYAKLVAAGERFRLQNQLPHGVNLSDAQMARLNEDIILMVDRTIILSDVRTVTRSVPQVYAKVRPEDLDTGGPTMGANRIDLHGSTFANGGQVGGRDRLRLNYRNIYNQGALVSHFGQVHATDTFKGRGGEIRAGGYFSATAGKVFDFGAKTATHTEKAPDEKTTESYHNHHLITETGKLTRMEKNSTVILGGAQQTTINAADLDLGDATSQTIIKGSNVHLGAEFVFTENMDRKDQRNFTYRFEGEHRGVQAFGDGDLTVAAGGKLVGVASQLQSGQGDINLYGAGGVHLHHGEQITKETEASHRKKRRIIYSKTNSSYREQEERTALPGTVSAQNINIVAGNNADLHLTGQHIVSDHGTHLQAGRDITIEGAQTQISGENRHYQKKSGIFRVGFGVQIGSDRQYRLSRIGSLSGHTDKTP